MPAPFLGLSLAASLRGQRRVAPLSKIALGNFIELATLVRFPHRPGKQISHREGGLFVCLVEVGGIEPPSASPTSMVLHA